VLQSLQEKDILSPPTTSIPAVGPTQPLRQYLLEVLSSGVMRPAREADHSPPSNVEIMNEWSYTSTPAVSLQDLHRTTVPLSLVSHHFEDPSVTPNP
jgi:hypothetical protein